MSELTCVHQREFCKCVVAKCVGALVDSRDKARNEAWTRLVTALRDAWPRCFMCRKPGHGVSDGEADWPVRVRCKEHSMHDDAIDVFPGADEAADLFALVTDTE